MSDPNADFKTLLDLTGGVQVRSAEHPDDRRQRHRLEVNAIRLIGAIAAFSALILVLSFFRPVPEKRADWAAGVLQLVLGGAVGFALKPKARAAVALLLNNGPGAVVALGAVVSGTVPPGAIVLGNPAVVVGEER